MVEPSVQHTHAYIKQSLTSYIESQYYLRHRSLFMERRSIMELPGEIAQVPYIEATPFYPERKHGFKGLSLPEPTIAFLNRAAEWPSSGVFPTPFQHQVDALEGGLTDGKDVLVASGTGSGKTETFLWSILARCEEEARERHGSWMLPGFRTLVLYPMNALVSDQLGRLRRGFGQSNIRNHFIQSHGRPIRFGMYTSRTPYAGLRTKEKDKSRIDRLVREFLRIEKTDPGQASRLKEAGRWPAKDLQAFANSNWETHPGDAELYCRHEIQGHAPDVLITNYSMLEYTLLRPIEASIFEQTRAWLAAHPKNVLTLVVDEAHLYKGTTGAEVGLLLRRLYHRLGIDRSKVRCILTSASLGAGSQGEEAMRSFAQDLVGENPSGIQIVTATPLNAAEGASRELSAEEIAQIAEMDLASLYAQDSDPEGFRGELLKGLKLGKENQADMPLAPKSVPAWLGKHMATWLPVSRLIGKVSGKAHPFHELAEFVFPGHPNQKAALERILALGAVARHPQGGGERPLVPVRAHMLYRGLPSLYACINPECTHRHAPTGDGYLLGKLHTSSRLQCECGARVFELHAHRDCGMPFLSFFLEEDGHFAWHEGSRLEPRRLQKILAAVPGAGEEPRIKADGYRVAWVHVWTGQISRSEPSGHQREHLKVWLPPIKEDGEIKWGRCPSCKRGKDQDSITNLATKGEEPIGAIIRAQFQVQPAIRKVERLQPNAGRKLLVFSDGRQAAAKLASRLPMEAQRDSFRETLALALTRAPQNRLDHRLYIAFVAAAAKNHLHFFSGADQERCLKHQDQFQKDFGGDLTEALGNDGEDPLVEASEVPKAFYVSLLAFLSNSLHSPFDLGLTSLSLPKKLMGSLEEAGKKFGLTTEDIASIVGLFCEHQIRSGSVFKEVSYFDKREALGAFRLRQTNEKGMPEHLLELLTSNGITQSATDAITELLFDQVCDFNSEDNVFYIRHPRVSLDFPSMEQPYLCRQCGRINLRPFRNQCGRCQSKQLERAPEGDPLIDSRRDLVLRGVRTALLTGRPSLCLSAEEHTAQLSYKDPEEANTTLEDHELRFQGVPLMGTSGQLAPPVDVLSCTTTMEVGIDIGSLTAVAMRNVPPRRENYQQRAGRAGRRGSALSTVTTYAQGGAHDAYSFQHPDWLVSGTPAPPRTRVQNETLAKRHVRGHLLQCYFAAKRGRPETSLEHSGLSIVFGKTGDFLDGDQDGFSFYGLQAWFKGLNHADINNLSSWLPFGAAKNSELYQLAAQVFFEDLARLRETKRWQGDPSRENLLDCLFEEGWMPRYAFPMDVVSLHLFEQKNNKVRLAEKPQQSLTIALSEYAPGRVLTIDKEQYQVGGLFIPGSMELKHVQQRIQEFVEAPQSITSCLQCTYLRYSSRPSAGSDSAACPLCGGVLQHNEALRPPGFSPKGGRPLTKLNVEEVYTRAEGAQFPLPDEPEHLPWRVLNPSIRFVHRSGQHLITWNRGDRQQGFSVCATCGATEPGPMNPTDPHKVPFLALGKQDCPSPDFRSGMGLYYRFPTDLLAMQMTWAAPMAFSLDEPWWEDALITLMEALRIASARHLDIDPEELKGGYRLVPGDEGQHLVAELFLYDTAAGGAGYAEKVGLDLEVVLGLALELLNCKNPACETGCRDCIENAGNKTMHHRFERKLAARLLCFALRGTLPELFAPEACDALLRPLKKWLELEGKNPETQLKPFPTGLSSAWVQALPAFKGYLGVPDYEFRRNLPRVKSLVM